MSHHGVVVVLVGLMLGDGAAGAKGYIIEPPDVLRIEVKGLPKEAQPVGGELLVRPDGTISLGKFGSVFVSGLTVEQTRDAILKQLAVPMKRMGKVEVRVAVAAVKSKMYYLTRASKDRW